MRISERQREILILIIEGYTYREIGEKLSITEGTVKKHTHTMLMVNDHPNMISLAVAAVKNRVI